MPSFAHVPRAYAILLGVVALQRLFELWLSRRHIASLPQSERVRVAEGRSGWIAMIALHTALIAAPAVEVAYLAPDPPRWLVVSAFAALCGAEVLRISSIATLKTAWNARGIVARTSPVVARGPYRFVRHPNYAAVLIEFSAIPLCGGAYWSWLGLNLLHAPILAARIRGEERWLMQDEDWRRTMAAKPRFFPRWS